MSVFFQLANFVPLSGRDGIDNAGLEFTRASFIIFTVVAPLCQVLILAVLWVGPLSFKWQRRLLHTQEVACV